MAERDDAGPRPGGGDPDNPARYHVLRDQLRAPLEFEGGRNGYDDTAAPYRMPYFHWPRGRPGLRSGKGIQDREARPPKVPDVVRGHREPVSQRGRGDHTVKQGKRLSLPF